ncbi:hypothetical protein LSCM1_00729 [Leishmania martiniquensis]|uniref:Amino acid transporter transmembrane domain-containing protein n=1 Tax=Leishmania martiniquensis TaxID=1580590 RepID=A0A836K668_9TRYP|nr:hypothetical protein LSCM1_00729 [Leishmania martiniquensis]
MPGEADEKTPLIESTKGAPYHGGAASSAAEECDWCKPNHDSTFFDNRTFSSLEEMKGSLLESCFPGDSVLSGALWLVTSACTPTMLSLPLAFAIGGWAFALGCTFFCIAITFLSVRILALASISAASEDYELVAGFFLSTKGRWVVRFTLFFYNLGCALVYLKFIKDSVTPILVGRASFLPLWVRSDTGGALCLTASMLIITPLTFNSRLASLRTKGLVSNIFTMFIIFSITYRFFSPERVAGVSKTAEACTGAKQGLSTGRPTLLIPYMFSAPIFVFSYEVQSNVMAVIKDLHDRTGRKILVCTSLALGIMSVFYMSLGIMGSLTFPQLTSGNILSSYNVGTDVLMIVCQLMCCFSAAVSFVFCIFPCRLAAFMLLSGGSSTKIPKKTRARLGVTLSAICCVLAVFLPDAAKAVSILGALFSATLSMTLPALFAMGMRGSGTYLTSWADALLSWVLLLMGLLFSAVGTYMALALS